MLNITKEHKTPKMMLKLTINDIILPNDIDSTYNLNYQILYNQNKLCEYSLDKQHNSNIDCIELPIISYSDSIQVIIIEENNPEQIGSITFHAKIFAKLKGQTIQRWITLFDLPYDDEYDGDLLEDDEEIPKILISFSIDIPIKIELPKNPINKYSSSITIIPETKEESSPMNTSNSFRKHKGNDGDDDDNGQYHYKDQELVLEMVINTEESHQDKIHTENANDNCLEEQALDLQMLDNNKKVTNDLMTEKSINHEEISDSAHENIIEATKIKTAESTQYFDSNAFFNDKVTSHESRQEDKGLMRNANSEKNSIVMIGVNNPKQACQLIEDANRLLPTQAKINDYDPKKSDFNIDSKLNDLDIMVDHEGNLPDSKLNTLVAPLKPEDEDKDYFLNSEMERTKSQQNSLIKEKEGREDDGNDDNDGNNDAVVNDTSFEENEKRIYEEQIKEILEQRQILDTMEDMELEQGMKALSSLEFSNVDDLTQNNESQMKNDNFEQEELDKSSMKYQATSNDLLNVQERPGNELYLPEERNFLLENTKENLNSEMEKLLSRLQTLELENQAMKLANENYQIENDEYQTRIEFLTQKLLDANHEKETQIQAIQEQLNDIKNDNDKITALNIGLTNELNIIKQSLQKENLNAMVNKEQESKKLTEIENQFKELSKKIEDQSLELIKLKTENNDLKKKNIELQDVWIDKENLQDKVDELKIENEKLKSSLASAQEKLFLTANELAKNTALADNQNQIIAKLNQKLLMLENNHNPAHSHSTQSLSHPKQQKQPLPLGTPSQGTASQKTLETTANNNSSLYQLSKLIISDDTNSTNNNHYQLSNQVSSGKSISSSNSDTRSTDKNQSPCIQLLNRQSSKTLNLNSMTNHPLIKPDKVSDFDIDAIDLKINECISTINIPIIPIKLSEGQYRFGTKKLQISIINNIGYVKILGGYVPMDEYIKCYARIEANKIKKLKINDFEYTIMSQETVVPELRHLILWNEDLLASGNSNNINFGISNAKVLTKSKYCSQSPKAKHKENTQNIVHLSNDFNSKSKKLLVDLAKANEVSKPKIQVNDNSPKYGSVGSSFASPKASFNNKKSGAFDNITNNQMNGDTGLNNQGLSMIQNKGNNGHLLNAYSNYYDNNNDMYNHNPRLAKANQTNNGKLGSSAERVMLQRVNARKGQYGIII